MPLAHRMGMGGGRASQVQLQLDSLTLSDNVLTTVCQSVQSTMHTELVGEAGPFPLAGIGLVTDMSASAP